jgi:thioredoxin
MNKVLVSCVMMSVLLFFSCGGTRADNHEKSEKTMATIPLTTSEFQTKIADLSNDSKEWKYLGDKPAIIDFYASWCGPCRAVAPILEELAGEYADKIYIYKVDTEKEEELAAMFGIRSIPSILFIPMNGTPQMAMGAMPKAEFEKAIKEILLK